MSKLIVTAPVLALSAVSAPAYAQDVSWTGVYVGVHGAFVDTQPTWRGNNVYQTVVDGGEGSFTVVPHNDTISAEPSHTEVGGGGRIGVDYQLGAFVVGAEADATFFKYDRAVTNSSAAASYTLRTRASNLETIRAKAGLAFQNVMIYATGGVAFSNVKHTLTATDMSQVLVDGGEGGISVDAVHPAQSVINAATANLVASDKVDTGWTAGGGAELRITPKFSIGLTLLHVDFGKDRLADASPPSSIAAQVKTKMFVGLLGVNLRF